MKLFMSSTLLIWMLACGDQAEVVQKEVKLKSGFNRHHELVDSAGNENKSSTVNIDLGENSLSANINSVGDVTILDYPSEWRSKAVVNAFYGDDKVGSPFSPEHCDKIKRHANQGLVLGTVRNSYPSRLVFEIAPFIGSEFIKPIMDSAQSAGINLSSFYVVNPIKEMNGRLEITYSDNALSHGSGQLWIFQDVLNISQRGMYVDSYKKDLIISAGDIICDLISGAATMTMVYPITGESRSVRVVYEPLKVKIN